MLIIGIFKAARFFQSPCFNLIPRHGNVYTTASLNDMTIVSVWTELSLSLCPALSSSLFQSTVTMIPAHDSPLAALTFNSSATKLASASERVRQSLEKSD